MAAGSPLQEAFAMLDAAEQYSAALRSLLDRRELASALDLVDEMTSSRLVLTSADMQRLVNTAIEAEGEGLVGTIQRCRANGAAHVFGMAQLSLAPDDTAVRELPGDDSGAEIAGAAAAGLLATGAMLAHPPAALVLPGLASAWGVDRYTQRGKAFELIGKGLARLDQGPLARDLRRESAIDAASFLSGYVLGLACCTSSPAVDVAIALLRGAAPQEATLAIASALPPAERAPAPRAIGGAPVTDDDPLDSPGAQPGARADASSPAIRARLVDRLLVWLLAPTALEAATFGEVRISRPSLAREFLATAHRRQAWLAVDVDEGPSSCGGWWGTSAEDDERRLRWAFAEASALLRRCQGTQVELEERMAEGVSIGACVCLVEERLHYAQM